MSHKSVFPGISMADEDAIIRTRIITRMDKSTYGHQNLKELAIKWFAFATEAQSQTTHNLQKTYYELSKELSLYEIEVAHVNAMLSARRHDMDDALKEINRINTLMGLIPLKRLIAVLPERTNTEAAIKDEEAAIDALNAQLTLVDAELDLRQKQFSSMFGAVDDLTSDPNDWF